jgi:hypothetical protein
MPPHAARHCRGPLEPSSPQTPAPAGGCPTAQLLAPLSSLPSLTSGARGGRGLAEELLSHISFSPNGELIFLPSLNAAAEPEPGAEPDTEPGGAAGSAAGENGVSGEGAASPSLAVRSCVAPSPSALPLGPARCPARPRMCLSRTSLGSSALLPPPLPARRPPGTRFTYSEATPPPYTLLGRVLASLFSPDSSG